MSEITADMSKMSTTNIVEGLSRLADSMKEIDDRKSCFLRHYQEIPEDVQQSYELMLQGATLVHATSTKYTLVGKISAEGQDKVAQDLLQGCQCIGAGALVIGDDSYGCSRSTRLHTKRACRAVISTVLQLVQAFVDAYDDSRSGSNSSSSGLLEKDNNVAAQKCGAVWQTCEIFLQKKLPQGNRNAMRRDLFTWMIQCNETMTEFQEMIDRGPSETTKEESADNNDGEDDDDGFHDFFDGGEDQYSPSELEVAKPCVFLVKCSRGTMNVAMKASELAGDILKESNLDDDKKKTVLAWIGSVHDEARRIGEGMTDLGSLLYPTLPLDEVEEQGGKQCQAILAVIERVLDTTDMELSEEVIELATKLRAAAQARQEELTKAIAAAR